MASFTSVHARAIGGRCDTALWDSESREHLFFCRCDAITFPHPILPEYNSFDESTECSDAGALRATAELRRLFVEMTESPNYAVDPARAYTSLSEYRLPSTNSTLIAWLAQEDPGTLFDRLLKENSPLRVAFGAAAFRGVSSLFEGHLSAEEVQSQGGTTATIVGHKDDDDDGDDGDKGKVSCPKFTGL